MPYTAYHGSLADISRRPGRVRGPGSEIDPLVAQYNARGAAKLRSQYMANNQRKEINDAGKTNPHIPTFPSRPIVDPTGWSVEDKASMPKNYLGGFQERIRNIPGLTGGFSSGADPRGLGIPSSAYYAQGIVPDSSGDYKPRVHVNEDDFGSHKDKPVYTHELSHFLEGNSSATPSQIQGLSNIHSESKATTAEIAMALAMGWDPSAVGNSTTGKPISKSQLANFEKLKSLAFPDGAPDAEQLRKSPAYYHQQQMKMLTALHDPESGLGKAYNQYLSELMPHAQFNESKNFMGGTTSRLGAKDPAVMQLSNRMWAPNPHATWEGATLPERMSRELQFGTSSHQSGVGQPYTNPWHSTQLDVPDVTNPFQPQQSEDVSADQVFEEMDWLDGMPVDNPFLRWGNSDSQARQAPRPPVNTSVAPPTQSNTPAEPNLFGSSASNISQPTTGTSTKPTPSSDVLDGGSTITGK